MGRSRTAWRHVPSPPRRVRRRYTALWLALVCIACNGAKEPPHPATSVPISEARKRVTGTLDEQNQLRILRVDPTSMQALDGSQQASTQSVGHTTQSLTSAVSPGEVGASPFFEAGGSFNLGTAAYSEEHPGNRNYAELLMTPVAIGSGGLRAALGTKLFLTSRVGWAWRLREDNYRMRDGSRPDAFTEDVIDLLQHGGLLTSLTLGLAFY
ncbi:hypothetical protein DRW03_18080 [Corallococcus sp. H22C18031201]|nr:hypothetical protein DRW03_18080 [Corallococcus sp. H22C18031201]